MKTNHEKKLELKLNEWIEIAEGLYFSLNNDGVILNNPLSKIMAKSTSRKYERAKKYLKV